MAIPPTNPTIQYASERPKADLATLDRSITELEVFRDTPNLHLLYEFTCLKKLLVGRCDMPTLECVSEMSSLEHLTLGLSRGDLPRRFNLPALHTLHLLDFFDVTHIEPLATLSRVQTLSVSGCKKLEDYSPLGKLRGLRKLEIGIRRYYEKMSAASLSFLHDLPNLEHLAVFFTSILDGSIDAIGDLSRLHTLEISNGFSRESLARLAARLPTTSCGCFKGWHSLGECPKCQGDLIMMTGKGSRTLCRVCQKARFETKLAEWDELVAAERRKE